MLRPDVVLKMRESMKGKTFLSRGGNSKLTKPQVLLAGLLGWPMEVAIPTRAVKHLFPSLPNHYKVDIANVEAKLAVEVDGNTHRLKEWKRHDKKKESVLRALGWSVLRFWNETVLQDVSGVANTILSCTTSKSPTHTTSLPTA